MLTLQFACGDDTQLNRRGLKCLVRPVQWGKRASRPTAIKSRFYRGSLGALLGRAVRGHRLIMFDKRASNPRTLLGVADSGTLVSQQKSAEKWGRVYRTQPELMLDMLKLVHAHDLEQSLPPSFQEKWLGDSAFTSSPMLKKMPKAIAVTGRIFYNSRIHAPAPKRQPGQRGQTRVRGERLDTPEEMLDARGLRRVGLKLYESTEFKVRLAEQEGFLFNAPNRPVKVWATSQPSTTGRRADVRATAEGLSGNTVELVV